MIRLLAVLFVLLSTTTVHAAPLPLRQTSGEVWIKLTRAGHNEGIGFVVCYTGQGYGYYYDLPAGAPITVGRMPITQTHRSEWRAVDSQFSIARSRQGVILHRNGVVYAIHLEANK